VASIINVALEGTISPGQAQGRRDRMKMVFTEVMGAKDRLRDAFPDDELVMFDDPLDRDELVHEAEGATVLSVFIRTRVDGEVIDSLPGLRMINTRSVGFDHIDVGHAIDKGIEVTHVAEYGPHVVAEHTFCLMLACARDLVDADRSAKEDERFDFHPFRGIELRDKVLGVLGTGRIGSEVIRIARGFGMNVIAYDMYPNEALAREHAFSYRSLEEVLEDSDIITIHLPLTDDTKGLMGREALKRMRKGSILVNTARGPIVDEEALKDALDSGHLRAAGVDVIADESDPGSSPLIGSDRVIMTPHIGFFTGEAVERMLEHSIDIIRSFRSGSIKGRVPVEYVTASRPRSG
jgi:D-lactate dehydrogenase